MLDRWKKLHKDLYNAKTDSFDLSKVPDVHDNIRWVRSMWCCVRRLCGGQGKEGLSVATETNQCPGPHSSVRPSRK